ncbi:hypothetical protein AQJ91_32935 [Streptomyces dysideae]|uniref:Uncharacterized protein n=1 Tax=Streptomyces dysideae TaxID=909626 RepID=A0A101UUN1_9ACTN|nr:hypothetical protein AQJ91_32935 [Streptomyces dysideae]
MGQEGGGPSWSLRWEVSGEGLPYGGGADVAFQPGGDAWGEVGGVAGGEEEAGVVAAEVGEEVGGLLEEGRGGVGGLRDGGEVLLAGCRLLRRRRVGWPCGFAVGVAAGSGLRADCRRSCG